MKIITEPKVTFITSQVFKYPEHIDWRSDIDWAADIIPEFAGRLCYLSYGKGAMDGHQSINGRPFNKKYIENIINVKHGSVLEHSVFGFLIEGVSRSLSHELVRHRAGFSYSQLSQRYVDESEVAFVLPPELEDSENTEHSFTRPEYYKWYKACECSLDAYKSLLRVLERELDKEDLTVTVRKKRARQTARSILPNCTETKIVVTANARAWRHFIELRASPGADTEIRRLAVAILKSLRIDAPHIFGDYEIVNHTDGTEIAVTENVGV